MRPAAGGDLDRVFAAELLEQLTWFVGARWAVGGTLLLFAAVAPAAGMPVEWHRTWLVGILVFAYNSAFHAVLAGRRRHEVLPHRWLARCAFLQILVDLAALLLFVNLTGGVGSPFWVFFVFHMALGTIMLPLRTMLLLAAAVWVASAALFLAEPAAAAPFRLMPEERAAALTALAAALGFTVYLTGTVSDRFKDRGLRLFTLAEQLTTKTRELERLVREMRGIEERKSKFMLLSAHQLRSPLATVKTSLEVIRQGYVDPGTERAGRLLAGASDRVDGLLAIVSDLLELAKLREGVKRAPWSRNVNVGQLLTDIVDDLYGFAEQRGVHLEATVSADAVLALGVPPDLVYALENLVHNAIKYSKPEGGRVVVRQATGPDSVTVEVEDDGIGIPEEMLDQVFLEFMRAPNARSHTGEGTGLGLAIVREVVEAHGGTVTVSSVEGAGSLFTVRLPLAGSPAGRQVVTVE